MPDARTERPTPLAEHQGREAGAISSIQRAELPAPSRSAALGPPEALGAGYWAHVRRATLGLIRVVEDDGAPSIVLVGRPLRLLRFGPPEYERAADLVAVRWPIEGGLLVAAEGRGRGWLRIELRGSAVRSAVNGDDGPSADGAPDGPVQATVEVGEYRPRLRRRGRLERLSGWVYANTQLRIHRRLGYGFLRTLARTSKTGTPIWTSDAEAAR